MLKIRFSEMKPEWDRYSEKHIPNWNTQYHKPDLAGVAMAVSNNLQPVMCE